MNKANRRVVTKDCRSSLERSVAAGSATVLMIYACGLNAAEPGAAESQTTRPVLEEVVVTAQKRAENLQDVPISISAFTADALTASGVESSVGIASLSPSVVITDVIGNPAVFIRGVGTPNVAAGEESSNSLYVDGVLHASIAAGAFALNNIERIEVLKGPQGTLFGRNATGGLIHIVTRDPVHEPTLEMSVGYGNYETSRGSFYGSTGLADNLAVDLAVTYLHQGDGFGTNLTYDEDVYKMEEIALRSKVLLDIGDASLLLLSLDYSDADSTMGSPRSIIPGSVGVTGMTYIGDPFTVRNDRENQGLTTRNKGISLRFEHDFGAAQFMSLSAYRENFYYGGFDQDGSPTKLVDVRYDQSAHQFTQELQVQAPDTHTVQWIAGAFFLDAQEDFEPLAISGLSQAALGGFFHLYSRTKTQSLAGYTQATVPIAESTNLTAGLRYTRDEKSLVGEMRTGSPVTPILMPTDKEDSWSKLTYRAALDHKFTDDLMAYASWSRGYKSGGFNGSNLANAAIDPETLDAGEIGLKSTLAGGRIRANLAAYHYDYKDIQLQQIIVGTQLILNAAEATLYGLEGDFVFAPTTNLELRASFGFSHAEYDDFPNAPASIPNPVTAIPDGYTCTPPFPVTAGGNTRCTINNAAGNEMIRAPEVTYTLGMNYTIPARHGDWNIDLNYYYNSGFYYEPDNRVEQPSYGLLGAQLSWRSPDERYGVRLWGRNLTDETYYTYFSSSVGDLGTWAAPRTYGVTFDMKL